MTDRPTVCIVQLQGKSYPVSEPTYGELLDFMESHQGRAPNQAELQAMCINASVTFVRKLPISEGFLLNAAVQPIVNKLQIAFDSPNSGPRN